MTKTIPAALREERLRLVEEHCRVENSNDLDGIMQTFGNAPTFTLNGASFDGREMVQAVYAGFGFGGAGSFSNLHLDVVRRHVNDETVILEFTLSGKHTAEWNGLPPTGKEFSVPACGIFTFDEAGKLAGESVYFDGVAMLKQLGALA